MAVIKEMTELNIFPTEKMFVKLISHLIDQTKDQESYRNSETDTRRLNDIEKLLRDTYGYAPNCIDLDTHHRPNRLSQVLWKRWLRARIQISGHLSAFQLASRLIFVSSSHARPSEKAGVCMQSWVTIMPMSPKTTSFELNHRSNLVRKIAVPYSPYVQLAIECGAMGAHSATLAAWKMIPLHVKPPVEALRAMIAATDPESLYKLWQSIPVEYKKQDIILLAFLQSGLKHKNLNAQFVDDVIKLSGPIIHKRVWQRTLIKVYAAINQPEKLLEVILAHAGNGERCRNTFLYIEPLSAIRSVANRAFVWHVVVRLFQLPAIRRDQELVNALLNLSKRCLVSSELSLEDIDKQFDVHPTPATTNPVVEASICMSADRVQPKAFS